MISEEIKNRRDRIKELYNKGITQKEIAKELGVSVATISNDIAYLKEQEENIERIYVQINERRKKVKGLYHKGKSQKEIAQELEVSNSTISSDIAYLKEQGKMIKRRGKQIEERRKRVKELYKEGKSRKEIAQELEASEATISSDMTYLKNKGEIIGIQERRKRVKELYNEGKGQKEIAQELKVSDATILNDIAYLRNQGEIITRIGKQIEERRKQVKELYQEGKSRKEIAQKLNVSKGTILNDIAYLKEQEENIERIDVQIQERRKKVKELYHEGNSQKEIAQELGVTVITVANDIAYLKKQEEISKRIDVHIQERRKKVKELYNEGKSQKEIAKELGVSVATISNDIAYLKEKGEISERIDVHIQERRKRVKELYNEGKSQKEIAQKLGVSVVKISTDIAVLKEQGEISERIEVQIQERREKVKELYEEGKSRKEIAQKLNVSQGTILNDIAYLKKQGEISKRINVQLQERRKRVKELYNEGISQKEIAQKLRVSEVTISSDIACLKEQGEIIEIIEKRRKQVKELYEEGKSRKEIAQKLRVSEATISIDIACLKEQGEIIEIIEKRRKQVKELYEEGKSRKEIAQKFGVSDVTISNDIAYLKKQGEISKRIDVQIEERRKKVKELYREGKSQKEIAQELNVSKGTISNDIAYLKEQEENIERIDVQQQERRKKVKELYREGKSQKEIAQELGVTVTTVSNDITYLKKQGEISKRIDVQLQERRKRVKELYNEGISQKEIAQKLRVSEATISSDIACLKEQGEIIEIIEERRKQVKELYQEGKSRKEIAQKLNVSKGTILNDIEYLKKQGEISKRIDVQIQERRKRVKELYNEGKSPKEIAQELEISDETISSDIAYLKEQEENIERIDVQQRERRKQVKELYEEGKSRKEIAQKLRVSEATISSDIACLKEQGEIIEIIEKRRKQVKELYEEGKSRKEMAQKFGVSDVTISNDIAYLKKQGEISKRIDVQIEERRKKVKELHNEGKSQKEIAKKLNVSKGTILNDIVYLKKQGEILGIEERRKRVKELYNEGISQKEIAQELNVSRGTISGDIKYLEKQGEIKKRKRSDIFILTEEKIEKLCDGFYGQPRSKQHFERYISKCKSKFIQGSVLNKEEISTIEKVVGLTEEYEDIVFYLKVSIRYGRFGQAIKFANSQMNNEKLTEEEKDKIKKIGEEIQSANKKYIATKELKRGGGIQQAIECSGLPKEIVISLNRELLRKNEEAIRKKEENDNGEEPRRRN